MEESETDSEAFAYRLTKVRLYRHMISGKESLFASRRLNLVLLIGIPMHSSSFILKMWRTCLERPEMLETFVITSEPNTHLFACER